MCELTQEGAETLSDERHEEGKLQITREFNVTCACKQEVIQEGATCHVETHVAQESCKCNECIHGPQACACCIALSLHCNLRHDGVPTSCIAL